jgi:hypothetical protein
MKKNFLKCTIYDAVEYGNYMASVVYGSLEEWNKGKPKYSKKNLYNSHFLHHITHTDIEPRPLVWQAGD